MFDSLTGRLGEVFGKLTKRGALSEGDVDAAMREVLGEDFVKLFATVKRFELARFRAHVTDWERDEYLEVH